MYAIQGTVINGKIRMPAAHYTNLDFHAESSLVGDYYMVNELPQYLPSSKAGIQSVAYLDVQTLEYIYIEEVVPLTLEEQIKAQQERIDQLTVLVAMQGGAIVG